MSPTLPNMSAGNALNRPILSPSPMGLGRRGWRSGPRSASVFRRLGRGVARRPSHANGAVAEEIDSIKHLSRITTWFYIALYAFIVHDRRLVRVARARPAGGRVPSHAPTMASSCTASLVLMRVVPAAA